ncbi:mechanosensitive ion channel protein 10-like [Impatiens glandulifera]|uniref:mechanosensitive ion channel protein 10-like n=1 Tax=Impatiens glandulifera TaxID=253017 RepID=UPI001FB0ECCD|nr:mechanosensitive ion channel protein 10-like [Impatiens glandulifera]
METADSNTQKLKAPPSPTTTTTINEVVLSISAIQDDDYSSSCTTFKPTPLDLPSRPVQATSIPTPSSPEILILNSNPSPGRPPKIPQENLTLRRRSSLSRSPYSKPKSRLLEPSDDDARFIQGKDVSIIKSPQMGTTTPKGDVMKITTAPVTPRTPLISPSMRAANDDEEDDDDDVYKTSNVGIVEKSGMKLRVVVLIELVMFVCIMGVLVASLTISKLHGHMLWGLEIWKWCVLVLVIFCGRLFTEWFINVLVFLLEKNFLRKRKVLYFVFAMKNSVRVSLWLALILMAWALLINRGVKRSRKTTRILNYITRALASCLIGAGLWMVKTILLKLVASSFHVSRFFDRIQESIFHQYVLQTLSGNPLMEYVGKSDSKSSSVQLSFRKQTKGKKEKQKVIDVEKLHKMTQDKISAWTMRGLIEVISGSGLSTLSSALDESIDDEGVEQKEITSEVEAKAAAIRIFKNVAKRGHKYIEEEDLLRFMRKEEADNVLHFFEGAVATGRIPKSSWKTWVVNVYNDRKSLAHSLNDTKTAIEELNKIVSGILCVVIVLVWLLLMGLLSTNVLVFISSQLLLVVFIFGNTCKTVFEAMIFVFVMHPFDVGDRCVIDGVQMVVEEMNILTTVFLRYDNEKIFYPNTVLATKPISNFYRSPEMGDYVEFTIDVSTSVESILALKAKIKLYLESKPQYWRPGHGVTVKDIENMNKMKMGLSVSHTINFQNIGEKSSRRSELLFELKKIFEELAIKYNLLPQEVHLKYAGNYSSQGPAP